MAGIVSITRADQQYPASLGAYLGEHAPKCISALGNLELLTPGLLALFVSVKCPGNLILQTYDLAGDLRESGITVVGGFHSPMEQECLRILLRGSQPIILCPARNIGPRLAREFAEPLDKGRILLLSPFEEKNDRPTAEVAFQRNRFVAALADAIFIAYAEPNGKMERLCRQVLAWRKAVLTLDDQANTHLIDLGATPSDPSTAALSFKSALGLDS